MATAENWWAWSTTAADNATADSSVNWAEGQDPGTVNNSARSVMAAIKKGLNVFSGNVTVGGTADAITITTGQSISSGHQALGFRFCFKAGGTNTGAVTVNVDTLGTQAVKRPDGTALSAGDIVSGGFYDLAYDGTNYILLNGVNPTTVVTLAANNPFTGTNTFSLATAAAVPVEIISTEAGAAAGPLLSLYRNSASPADGDVGPAVYFYGEDSGGTKTLFGSMTAVFDDITDTTEDASLHFSIITAGSLADEWTLSGAGFYPTTNDGASLGISGNAVSDAYFATGARLDFGAGDVTLTHSSNNLQVDGGTLGVTGTCAADIFNATTGFQIGGSNLLTTLSFITSMLNTIGGTKGNILYCSATGVWSALAPP